MRRLLGGMLAVLMMGLGLVATPAQAQDNNFVGVSAVSIFVDHPTGDDSAKDAAKCNVTKSGLDAAARLPLDASRLRINPDVSPLSPYVYVSVSALWEPRGCAAFVQVSLKRSLAIPGTNQLVFGATVWERGYVLTGPSSGFGQRVNQQVTDYTKELIAEWIKANPR